MNIVIFTGAGAAKADGGPLQTELFRAFFAPGVLSERRQALRDDVAQLFNLLFAVDPRVTASANLPTFEEALGVLELAIAREEGLVGIGHPGTFGDLRHARRQLILALATTVAREPGTAGACHRQLVDSLRDRGLLPEVTFVTTNYDTLLDDAVDARGVVVDRGTGSLLDYGFSGLIPDSSGLHADQHRFLVLKIHGSLNWLYCPVCDILDITYASSGVTRLVDEPEDALCSNCEALRTPVIVPPSYYKSMSSVHLATVWAGAYRALKEADQLIFCGYSFPDADMHVKYLVKRAQLNRDSLMRPLKTVLVNQHPAKSLTVATAEAERFKRFLGSDAVIDSGLSFQQFASDPARVVQEATRP